MENEIELKAETSGDDLIRYVHLVVISQEKKILFKTTAPGKNRKIAKKNCVDYADSKN